MQARLPEGVETVVKALAREKTSLELAIRRIRKKLGIAPAEKVREAPNKGQVWKVRPLHDQKWMRGV